MYETARYEKHAPGHPPQFFRISLSVGCITESNQIEGAVFVVDSRKVRRAAKIRQDYLASSHMHCRGFGHVPRLHCTNAISNLVH